MKLQPVLAVVTLFNVLVLLFSLSQTRAVMAEGAAPLLRGRALEIVDAHGQDAGWHDRLP
jgi:hypothetical protein